MDCDTWYAVSMGEIELWGWASCNIVAEPLLRIPLGLALRLFRLLTRTQLQLKAGRGGSLAGRWVIGIFALNHLTLPVKPTAGEPNSDWDSLLLRAW
jgi:hypothetical protein